MRGLMFALAAAFLAASADAGQTQGRLQSKFSADGELMAGAGLLSVTLVHVEDTLTTELPCTIGHALSAEDGCQMCQANTYSLGQACTPCEKGFASRAGASSCMEEALMQISSAEQTNKQKLFDRLGSRLRGTH